MSRKKRRDKRNDDSINDNNPMGLNPQLLNMLGANNIDISKVSQMMAAMNQDGFDINSIGNLLSGGKGNPMANMQVNQNMQGMPNIPGMPAEFANIANLMNNMNSNNNSFGNNMSNNRSFSNNMSNNFKHKVRNNTANSNTNIKSEDENIEMLLAVKSVVNNQKARFIDKVIEMYKNGEIEY